MNAWCTIMRRHKWTVNEQASFLKRTGELLERGYPISEAIESISLHLSEIRKKEMNQCLIDLKKGLLFHEVLRHLGFHKDLIGYVYFAEQHGSFADALLEGSRLALLKEKDLHKLTKLLQYPMLLLMITGFLFFFVKNTLLPRFTILFTSMGLKANFFTKVTYGLDRYFPLIIYFVCFLLTLASSYYLLIFRRKTILMQRSLLVRIPIAGRILKLFFTHYFSIQLSFLLAGGISVSEALYLFEQNKGELFFSALSSEIKRKLVTGEKLEVILSSFTFFEKEFAMIVKHGQENGKLEQELSFFSQHCITLIEEVIERYLKIIQPVLYLVIGFLVVSMYLAILLPMFHLMDAI
jgi:competence protein ComGB